MKTILTNNFKKIASNLNPPADTHTAPAITPFRDTHSVKDFFTKNDNSEDAIKKRWKKKGKPKTVTVYQTGVKVPAVDDLSS
jgi:hypothetical protein